MLARLFRANRRAADMAYALYGAIVAQARAPALYAGIGVPDSISGRFEMVMLHTFLVVEGLKRGGEPDRALGQQVFDLFCRDMDQSLRELGFGDLAVPKRMKEMGEAYYGRSETYRRSLTNRAGLAEAIERNVFAEAAGAVAAESLAAYMMAAAGRLAALPAGALAGGRVAFPDPAEFVGA